MKNIIIGWYYLLIGKNKKKSIDRLRICRTCLLYTTKKTCSYCGCYMPAKTKIIDTECGVGKW